MMHLLSRKVMPLWIFGLLLFAACAGEGSGSSDGNTTRTGKTEYPDRVVIHNLSDPDGLHPSNSTSAAATDMRKYCRR